MQCYWNVFDAHVSCLGVTTVNAASSLYYSLTDPMLPMNLVQLSITLFVREVGAYEHAISPID